MSASVQASPQAPAILFDLDGTLIDSVYQHVLAWRDALGQVGLDIPCWTIHRHIGMSGGLLVRALSREAGKRFSREEISHVEKLQGAGYEKRLPEVRTLPGAGDLLRRLSQLAVPWAIATSGKRKDMEPFLKMLGLDADATVVTRDDVPRAKPDPDLFLAAAERLAIDIKYCIVVGDSVWDLLAAQRARALGVAVLSGGFGEDELMRAGAYRAYRDPADLLAHLDEIGIRTEE